MRDIKEDLLKKYVYKIKNLECSIALINRFDSKHKGFIINLNDYNNLKNRIQYENNKKFLSKSMYDIKDDEKIIEIKDIEFKTRQYLLNMLLNGNKYIIIDSTFWKVICEKGKEFSTVINYEISNNMTLLNLKLRDNQILMFYNNKKDNILEESKLKNKSGNNFDLIKNAFRNINTYYDFETKIQNDLKAKKESKITGKGYLIEKNWIDKWKQQIQYEEIKTDFLFSNKSDKEIRDKLIYLYEVNKYKLIDLYKIKNEELKDKQKIEECLKRNSLVLVNSDFIKSFEQNNLLSEINYNLYEDTIEIELGPHNYLQFHSKNNIILSFENDNINNEAQYSEIICRTKDDNFAKDILSILLNFNLGLKEFIDKVEYSKNNIINYINDYYLVNSDTFYQFIKFFSCSKVEAIINWYNLKKISDIDDNLLNKVTTENKVIVEKISELKGDFFEKFKIKRFFDIKSSEYGNVNDFKKYIYPSEFIIVSKNIKEKLCQIFGDINYNNVEEISLGFITGNIIFKPNKGQYFDNIRLFSYIFSLAKEVNGIIKFSPEILISFNTRNAINKFPKLVKDETLIDSCIKNISDINARYDCKAILINIVKYISISIKLNEEYSKFEKLTKDFFNYSENDCYLINKNFMESLEDILCFKEIDDIINKNKQITTEKQKLDKIFKEINPEDYKKLIELDKIKIMYFLKTREILDFDLRKSYLDKINKKKLYYDNCKLISKDIFDLIKDMTNIYIDKIREVKSIFDKGEIIILIKDGKNEVINVGNLENRNDLKIKSVIEKGALTPSEIFSKVKISGYDYIKNKNYIQSQKQNLKENEIFEFQNVDSNNHINKSNINLENNKKKEEQKFKYEDNQKYINQIEELKKQLLEEKENNNKLKSENKKLENIINSL